MGNIESQCQPEGAEPAYLLDEQSGRVIDQVDFATWTSSKHNQYGFPPPCTEYHNNSLLPYSCSKCFSLEVKVGRRRSVQFRKDLTRYTAELERFDGGRHSIHIRDHMTGVVVVVPLVKVASNLPELDILYDPILTVVAYHCDIMAIAVQEKTKNIPKAVIFCDVKHCQEVGQFVAQLNYSNLSGAQVECCISPDGSTFILYVLEDHYDEFHAHYHAVHFNDCQAEVICEEHLSRATWYEPGMHMAFLPDTNNMKLVILGEKPIGLAERYRYLTVYDLSKKCVVQGLELKDNMYPVSMAVSPDGMWIATMSRCPSQYQGSDTESYLIKLHTADTLSIITQTQLPLTIDAFNYMSMCNKVIFSANSKLVALPSTEDGTENLEFDWEYGAYYRHSDHRGTSGVTMTVFRLPVIRLTLKALCRDTILDYCSYASVKDLPLPNTIRDYVSFQD